MIRQILRFFGQFGKKTSRAQKSDLRYADPSHDPRNRKTKPPEPMLGPRKNYQSPPTDPLKILEEMFSNVKVLKQTTVSCINKYGRHGTNISTINYDVITTITGQSEFAEALLSKKWIRDRLSKIRKDLKIEGSIGYNSKDEVWYSKNIITRDLSEREERFLTSHGLGEGWKRITNEIDAIKWLHQKFTPDEFENFCISILKTHCKIELTVTEKRRISGADGGFDGAGEYTIDGKLEKVALQAKRYALERQVGEEHIDRFAGALIKNYWHHGIFITTSSFSKRAIESVKTFKNKGIWIELIDKNRLSQIMLTKTTEPHGYGLHRTDLGLVYINEGILQKAAKE